MSIDQTSISEHDLCQHVLGVTRYYYCSARGGGGQGKEQKGALILALTMSPYSLAPHLSSKASNPTTFFHWPLTAPL